MGDPAPLPAFEAIDRLGSLTEDWDSYEAPAISPAVREWAKVCLTQIQRHFGSSYGNPLVGPTPAAVVALIWRAKGQEVDVLCSPPKARDEVELPLGGVQVVGDQREGRLQLQPAGAAPCGHH